MKWLNILRARLRALMRREAVIDDIDEEMRSHVEMETEENIERGMRPEEARLAAMRSFGNLGRIRDLAYEVRGGGMIETLWQDLRYGGRMLLKQPGFTLIAVITLALGIGANTSIFSVVYAVLLRPLPYAEPERLVAVGVSTTEPRWRDGFVPFWSYPKFEILRDRNQSFTSVAGYTARSLEWTGKDEPERVQVEFVSASYFPTLGVTAAAGRTFTPEEDKTSVGHSVALISYGFWQRRLGGDTKDTGQSLELNKTPVTVVGVLSPDFKGQSGRIDVWLPISMMPKFIAPRILTLPQAHWLSVTARLRDGVTLEQGRAEMAVITRQIAEAISPSASAQLGEGEVILVPFSQHKLDPVIRKSFLIFLVAVGFVLLIACANIANLLLARAVTRRKEFAVRVALGATRGRIARQLLTESLLLSLTGGSLGLLLALWGVQMLATSGSQVSGSAFWSSYEQAFSFYSIRLDGGVLLFNFALALATGILFGSTPALQASRQDVNEALKDAVASSPSRARRLPRLSLRVALVVSQVAFALVLLIGAGLMIRSFARLQTVKLGFEPQNVLTMRIESREATMAFYQQLRERVAALPGVETATVASSVPLQGAAGTTSLTIEGRSPATGSHESQVHFHSVSADYFQTLRIPVLRGRGFIEADRAGAKRVAVINETAAERFWPGADPIGQRIRLGIEREQEYEWAEVIGVVGDVKYLRIEEPTEPDVYLSYLQPIHGTPFLLIRSAQDPTSLVAAVRHEVRALNKGIPIYDVKTMYERSVTAISRARFGALLLGMFAGLALLLAAVGIYGVMSYSVTQHTHEIGIRMALGANQRDVLRLVVGQGMTLTLIGVVIGLAGALALTRLMTSLLFDVNATDPATFTVIALLLTGVALLACYIPARRATKVDPMVALRYE